MGENKMPDISKMPPLPGAHYGKFQDQPGPDDDPPEVEGMDDDDDELMDEADPSLVAMLGFDPLELADEDEKSENKNANVKNR
jgi:hypothetical protein